MGVVDVTDKGGAGWLMISIVVLLTAVNLLNLLKAVVAALKQYHQTRMLNKRRLRL
jgi:hypothetical protein